MRLKRIFINEKAYTGNLTMKTERVRARLARAAAIGVTTLALLGIASVANAQLAPDDERPIRIKAQSLSDAIELLSGTYGVSIFADQAVVKDRRANAVTGTYDVESALSRLLEGTGVNAQRARSGGFLLQASEESQSVAGDSNDSISPETVEEIVVTGRFQNSLINRLPISNEELPFVVDSLTEETFEKRGFISHFDALQLVPNVTPSNNLTPRGNNYLVRGFDASTLLVNNKPENSLGGFGRRDISFVDRIEVGKGPMSIVVGPVTPGGVINQILKEAQDEDFLILEARGGSFGRYRLEADANRADLFGRGRVSGRLTVAYEDQQTPQNDIETQIFAIRPSMSVDFSPSTRAHIGVSYTSFDHSLFAGFPIFFDGTVPRQFDPETVFGIPITGDAEDVYVDAEIRHDFNENLRLVVRGSYQDTSTSPAGAEGRASSSLGPGIDPNDPQIELRFNDRKLDGTVEFVDTQLVGSFDAFGQSNDWVIGYTYLKEQRIADNLIGSGGYATIPLNDIDRAPAPVPDDYVLVPRLFDTIPRDTNGYYAEINLRPTDRLTLAGGARYDSLEASQSRDGVFLGRTSADDTVFRGGVTYKLSEDVNVFFGYAQSFIPQNGLLRNGGFADPETAENFEGGVKGSLLNGRLALSASAFHLTRNDVATPDPENDPGDPFIVLTGEQVHQGIEGTISLELFDGANLRATYGYTDAEITESNDGREGQQVDLVPFHSFSLYGDYEWRDGPLSGLAIGAGMQGISDRPVDTLPFEYDGFVTVDLYASYPISESILLQANLFNLLDEEYLATLGRPTPLNGFQFGEPRALYLTLRMRL